MRKFFVIVTLVICGAFPLSANLFADDNQAPAINAAENQSLSQKLDKVIATQDEILRQLDEVKSELQVVKIRASRA